MPITTSHYSSYGSALPDLQYLHTDKEGNGKYRFGFNTLLKETKIAGEGNVFSSEFRAYEARLKRSLKTDPKPNIFKSLYAVLENYSNKEIDINGDSIKVSGSGKYLLITNYNSFYKKKKNEIKTLFLYHLDLFL